VGRPSADFGTPEARERIVAAIAPGYRGEWHLAGALAQATLYILIAGSFLEDVRPWEWLILPATLVFANGVEWVVHRGPLHHQWPLVPRPAYNRHTLTHHSAFSSSNMAMRSWREMRLVLFPLYALPALELLISPVIALVWWGLGPNAGALFVIASVLYYVLYELLHLAYHFPADHALARHPLVAWLRRQHQRHHDPRRMTEGNFNVSIPLFDWLLGTRLREQEPDRS